MKMGGGSMDDGLELTTPADEVRTVVLVGRTGNGKSATGNSILGRDEFNSRPSFSGVTVTCSLQRTVLKDGQIVHVIDTPGLSNSIVGSQSIGREVVNCISLARDGIHAILLVFSIKSRFSTEEANVLQSLQSLFGEKIVDYIIVVFTGGDELQGDFSACLEGSPECMKKVLNLCRNRRVLFDNKTEDERKKTEQVQQLLSVVDSVVMQNRGKPWVDELFNEDHHFRYTEMVELKQKLMIAEKEQQLAEEKAALGS